MNNKGFTLVELLSVLMIMVAVSALAVPNILKFNNSMRDNGLDSKKEALRVAARVYAKENVNRIKRNLGGTRNEDGQQRYVCVFSLDYLVDHGAYAEEGIESTSCKVINPTDNSCLKGYIRVVLSKDYASVGTKFINSNTERLPACLP